METIKEITILSGKGGTGKTSIAAAIASLAKECVICDNDVDASDLHLILKPEIEKEKIFEGAYLPTVTIEKCIHCAKCAEYCRFDAITMKDNIPEINPYTCEGCRLCERICPSNAILSRRSIKSKWMISSTRMGTFVHAKMAPGEENSGKLVTIIRKHSKEIAIQNNISLIISDGPPGTGCTTISTLTGTTAVIIIMEPALTSLSDAKRLYSLVDTFHIPVFAIINKCTMDEETCSSISNWLNKMNIKLLGKIPFNKIILEAMVAEKSVNEYAPESEVSYELRNIWKLIKENIINKKAHYANP